MGPARGGEGPERAGRAGTPAQGRELRARGKRTMRKLLDAGMEVFASRGYHAARVDDIVKVAHTSHGTFYLYFANKEELLAALAQEVAEEMARLAESLGPLTPDADGYREMREWLERFSAMYERFAPVIRAWTEAEVGDSAFGRLGADVLAGFATALSARIRRSRAGDLDPAVAGIALVAMIERLHYYVLARQVDVDRGAMLDTLASVAHGALFGALPAGARRAPGRRRRT